MASEARIAANRRNARNSTGPRSASGKKRASRSALRHGLTKPMSGLAFAREVEALAHQIARDPADKIEMVSARQVAETQLELERVQRIKIALIERIAALGRLDPHNPFRTSKDEMAWAAQHFLGVTLGNIRPKCALDPLPPLPAEEPARTAGGSPSSRTKGVKQYAFSLIGMYSRKTNPICLFAYRHLGFGRRASGQIF